MPGVVGTVSKHHSPDLSRVFDALTHFSWLTAEEVVSQANTRVGVVRRNHIRSDVDYFSDEHSKVEVVLYGFASDSQTMRKLTAKEILSYCDKANNRLADVDGSFVILIRDPENSQVRLINDRLGSLPMYYQHNDSQFVFAPEAKGVLASLEQVTFDLAGVASFLTTGYCLGQQTLFESVCVLSPGSELTLDLHNWSLNEKHYWTLNYRADPNLDTRSNAEETLWEALLDSMKCSTIDAPDRMAVMLSGGWDSRGMLPLMKEIGGEFHVAKSWGYLDGVALSDVSLAREMAEQYSLPFDFVQYGSSTFVDNADEWCIISELMNDNFGWYAEGPTTLRNDYDKSIDCMFVGDEVWGWGTDVVSDDEVRAAVFPPRFPDTVKSILTPSIAEACELSYEATIEKIMARCQNDSPNDRKDFLYLYGRVARFIFSVGYYKEHGTPLRRPFFGKHALDVIQGLPPKHRIFKSVYRSMLKRRAPRLASVPVATVSSLPDWEFDLRNNDRLRSYFASLLDLKRIADGPCGEFLQPDSVAQIATREMSKQVLPVKRQRAFLRDVVGNAVRSNPVGRYLNRKLRPNVVKNSEAGQFRVLRRVALLTLLAEQFDIETPR